MNNENNNKAVEINKDIKNKYIDFNLIAKVEELRNKSKRFCHIENSKYSINSPTNRSTFVSMKKGL